MIKDLRSYFKIVAGRLTKAFAVEDFDMESEREFWSLAAEHISRKEPPKFIDIVHWMDLLYEAPIHFVYKKEQEAGKLSLYRRQVLVDNIKKIAGVRGDNLSKGQQKKVREYEEELENLEKRIHYDEEFLSIGISSHSIGKCEHIPIYDEEELWGIYCAGPHVSSPDSIKAKLSIVSRILSNWMLELDKNRKKPAQDYQEKAGEVASDLGTGTLNIDRIANLMLGYLAKLNSASSGGIIELSKGTPEFLAHFKMEGEAIQWVESVISVDDTKAEIKTKLNDPDSPIPKDDDTQVELSELKTQYSRAIIFLGKKGNKGSGNSIETNISKTLNDLLVYRRQNKEITNKLIDTYYKMLRELEKEKQRTYYHTPRMMALVERFSQLFGMDEEEQERLVLTARLHDVGYIVTQQLGNRMTVGAELEHPFIGGMLVEALPLNKEVKEGIKTHHEWINGSGTPQGLKGEDIPWTGKIIGLFEFVNEFIETHQDDEDKSDTEWIEKLSEEIIERAENQFDMVLVPSAIELIKSLGWKACCTLGTNE